MDILAVLLTVLEVLRLVRFRLFLRPVRSAGAGPAHEGPPTNHPSARHHDSHQSHRGAEVDRPRAAERTSSPSCLLVDPADSALFLSYDFHFVRDGLGFSDDLNSVSNLSRMASDPGPEEVAHDCYHSTASGTAHLL